MRSGATSCSCTMKYGLRIHEVELAPLAPRSWKTRSVPSATHSTPWRAEKLWSLDLSTTVSGTSSPGSRVQCEIPVDAIRELLPCQPAESGCQFNTLSGGARTRMEEQQCSPAGEPVQQEMVAAPVQVASTPVMPHDPRCRRLAQDWEVKSPSEYQPRSGGPLEPVSRWGAWMPRPMTRPGRSCAMRFRKDQPMRPA